MVVCTWHTVTSHAFLPGTPEQVCIETLQAQPTGLGTFFTTRLPKAFPFPLLLSCPHPRPCYLSQKDTLAGRSSNHLTLLCS